MKKTQANGQFSVGTILGVGVYDAKKTVKEAGESYRVWRSMLNRCYSEKYQERQTTYIGCAVCDEWKLFSIFDGWFVENYVKGFELDKDLLGDGLLYSPQNCCFLPKRINLALPKITKSGNIRGTRFNGSSFTSQSTGIDGKIVHLGSFDTNDAAFQAYCSFKESVLMKMSEQHKSELKENVYNALQCIDVRKFSHKLGI